jgi:tetratricopeptide (TPR) repeat protein
MFSNHPTRAELEVFLRDVTRAAATVNTLVVRHLLSGCHACREQLDLMGWERGRLERLLQLRPSRMNDEVSASVGYDYGSAFAGAERSLAAFLAQEQPAEASAGQLWAELSSLSAEEQVRRVGSGQRFASPELVRQLIEASRAARFDDPGKMLHMAHLACLAAESCTAEHCGSPERLADLRCQSWRQYAEGLRLQSRPRESEAAFARAQRLREGGTGDPIVRAQLLNALVSLRIFQRRFDEAIQLSEEAGQIYQEIGRTNSLVTTLVQKAIACIYAGEPGDAIPILNKAIPLINPADDPHLLLAACHNLVRCYIELDRPEQALSLFFEMRSLYREFDDAIIALRAGWQEGHMLRDLGYMRAAEAALVRTREGFSERKLLYEAALISLDLASMYVKLGDSEKLEQMVATTVPIFRALGVGRETLASLLQLRHLADQGRKAFELIRLLGTQVEQAGRKIANIANTANTAT